MENQILCKVDDADLKPDSYYEAMNFDQKAWRELTKLKDRKARLFQRREYEARAVIDAVANYLGIADNGHYLYGLVNGATPIIEKIETFMDKGGDKVKLKKRIDELETENNILRSLVKG